MRDNTKRRNFGDEDDLVRLATRIFNGHTLPDDMEDGLSERIAMIERGLARRAYSPGELESCVIGLRGFQGAHPEADATLERLITEAVRLGVSRSAARRWMQHST